LRARGGRGDEIDAGKVERKKEGRDPQRKSARKARSRARSSGLNQGGEERGRKKRVKTGTLGRKLRWADSSAPKDY